MTPYEAIISKRDLRVYTDQPIPDDVMHRILQAGGDFSSWIGSSAAIVGFAAPADQERRFDVGRQAQNMMVTAHAEGVGSCPITLHHADKASAAVNLPDGWSMGMVITLGYPVQDHPDSPLKRTRVPLDELVIHNSF